MIMEETMTLSQVADLIIVMTFAVTIFTFIINGLAELTFDLIDTVKKKRKARKEKKAEQAASTEE